MNATRHAPLSGIKVLDLTRLLPGPLCGQHLADLGADVIKIEDTQLGDYVRPSLRGLVNRGKKSLRLNLKTEAGKDIFRALVADCDVLIESFRPGAMERLGLDYESLAALNPRLVYCAISGFGQTGPRRLEAGHDINYQALTGVLHQTGLEGQPAIPGHLIADLAGGTLTAFAGIMVALFAAQRTGQGQFVDVSMTDSMMAQAVLPIALLNEGIEPASGGMGTHTGGTAHYRLYETLDGRHLAIGAQEKKFWDIFCDAIERPDLKDRHTHVISDNAQLKAEIGDAIRSRSLQAWMDVFQHQDCCVSPVLSIAEAVQDPHFRSRGVVQPSDSGYRVGLPFHLPAHPVDPLRESPSQGEHTRDILTQLGYDAAAIEQLAADNVIAKAGG